jgi:hypothetical protein
LGKRKNSLVPCPSPKNRFTPLNFYPVKSLNHFTGGSEGAPKGIQLGQEKPEKYLAEKTIEDVLLQFGDKLREARRRYRQFVKNGIAQGSRPDLQGGGLVRSAGGDKRGLLGRKKEERELGDARILGSGNFVSAILQDANELEERKTNYGIGLDELIMRVTGDIGIDMEDLLSSKREQKISYARGIISYLAAVKLGYNGTSLAKVLRMSRKSVSRSIKRGKKILGNNPKMLEYLI